MTLPSHKVTASHLKRTAYLYIRQSSMQQVFQNTESTERQYALRQRAVALGWRLEDISVVDCDQGHSGASAADRQGFQHLVAEVSMGRAGVVLGLEVSRLARNNSDWHRLLEICALSDTLIVDEDGIYNPCDFNDRLLLGLKGTMSEAELHMLRARLRGGLLNKARRGELKMPLPVGLTYDSADRVVLDPDQQVQNSVHHLFRTFRRTGSASATVKAFRDQKLLFPRRPRSGPGKGELVWGALTHNRTRQVLHNPRYAGAFVFGRHRQHRSPDGRMSFMPLPRDQWHTIQDATHDSAHPISPRGEHRRRLRRPRALCNTSPFRQRFRRGRANDPEQAPGSDPATNRPLRCQPEGNANPRAALAQGSAACAASRGLWARLARDARDAAIPRGHGGRRGTGRSPRQSYARCAALPALPRRLLPHDPRRRLDHVPPRRSRAK
jgi:DNA invertase Pin-like site-specific DNA recombinase